MIQTLASAGLMRRALKAALTMLVLETGLLSGCAVTAPDCSGSDLAYVGTDGSELRALRLDACTGRLTSIGTVAKTSRPRWAVANPQRPILYVASDEAGKDGRVVAFSIDHASGALTPINDVGAGGGGTTHLWLDVPSMTLLAANFGGGSISSIALNADGSLGALVSTIQSTGSGPHKRQAGPHAHGAVVDPSGRFALVSDLGADRIFVDRFDRATHALSPEDAAHPRAFSAPAGSGPHRVAFGADGRFVYLFNELTAELLTLRWDALNGQLALVQSLQTSSAEFQGTKSGAELALSRDGRFAYVENRGENALVVYRVDPESGELTFVQRIPSGGQKPWSLAIHPSGRWMLVANQQSNQVNLFRIDPASGLLTDTGQAVDAPAPLSVVFVR